MMARVDNIRASENLFIDTLDQNFAAFFARMDGPYSSWRKYTFEEEKAYKALKRKALTQQILGGLAILGAALADPGSPVASVARDAAMIGGMAAMHPLDEASGDHPGEGVLAGAGHRRQG